MKAGVCGKCYFWDFKIGADKNMGRCKNPLVRENIYISTKWHEPTVDIEKLEVYFEEENFGCIHFKKNNL